ncbi:aminoglycoside phosphotransferase family protein [Actinoplanes sp. NPDC049596]|uniref:phosphotransferase family protein n=1 Tax=unclassified Actinoplanes TaxID=2626549 RepID=UPI003419141A
MTTLLPRSQVPLDRLKAVLGKALGERMLDAEPIEDRGRFNDAVSLLGQSGRRWVARVAPDPRHLPYLRLEHGMLQREAAIADQIADRRLIPPTVYFDPGDELNGRAVLVRAFYEGINGQRLVANEPTAVEPLWRRLAEFDAGLAGMTQMTVGFPGVGSDKRWSDFVYRVAESLIADLTDFGVDTTEAALLLPEIERFASVLDARPTRLCHGDLWPKNVLVRTPRTSMNLTVLDWERAFVGDPRSQWLRYGRDGLTMFSVDRDPGRHVTANGRVTAEESLVDSIYLSIIALQSLAESIRIPLDQRKAAEMLRHSLDAIRLKSAE